MRILMISDQYPPIIGGTERQAEKLSREMVRRGHEVVVLTGRWSKEMLPFSVDQGVEIHRVSTWNTMGGIRGLRKFSSDIFHVNLRRALLKLGPGADVFHVHLVRRAAIVALETGKVLGIPVLVKETSSGENNSFHTLATTYRGQWMRRNFLRELRHIAVLNERAAMEYAAEPFRNLTIHRAINGIHIDENVPQWNPDQNLPTILYLGRLKLVKGAGTLLEAFELLHDKRPNWRIRFCGEGEGLNSLKQRAAEMRARERIEFPGPTLSPLEELSSASLLVLPSIAEGMSNTLLEAMAVGTPAVATDVGANGEMLEGDCGWLVPRLTPEALAEVMLKATASFEELQRRSSLAQKSVRTRYTLPKAAARYEEIYRSLG